MNNYKIYKILNKNLPQDISDLVIIYIGNSAKVYIFEHEYKYKRYSVQVYNNLESAYEKFLCELKEHMKYCDYLWTNEGDKERKLITKKCGKHSDSKSESESNSDSDSESNSENNSDTIMFECKTCDDIWLGQNDYLKSPSLSHYCLSKNKCEYSSFSIEQDTIDLNNDIILDCDI